MFWYISGLGSILDTEDTEATEDTAHLYLYNAS